MDTLSTLQSFGLELPSPAYIAGVILFGIVGMLAWYRGRKTHHPRTKWYGVALMFFPYAVSNTWLLYAIGAALCAAAYVDRG